MENRKWAIVFCFIFWLVGFTMGSFIEQTSNQPRKYKKNLKCVQGELYEEVRTNMFVKSHLECFEQRTF